MLKTATVDVETLEAMWGGEPAWLVVPCFADDLQDVAQAKECLRQVLGDRDPVFTVDSSESGAARLRRMAQVDARCSDFVLVADMLGNRFLVLAWVIR